MLFASLLAVVLLAAAEIYVIVAIAHVIGWALTVVLLIASTVAGLWLVRIQGRRAWNALRSAVTSGVVPDREIGDAALVVAGGALIAVPGFLTDVLGMLAVAPGTRSLTRRLFGLVLFRRAAGAGVRMGSRVSRARAGERAAAGGPPASAPRDGAPKTIRGEIIDDGTAAGDAGRRPS
jgi:UPF0716 family protein affecting phage T7 exclusion